MSKYITLFCLLGVSSMLGAQTAEKLDVFLEAETISYIQVVNFVLEARGFPESATEGEGFALALERGWLPRGTKAEAPVRLGALSLLIMRAFDLPGGIMYSVFPSPRYACRELAYKKINLGRSDPALIVSGPQFLRILGRVLVYTGEPEADFE
jgi:hypothetical protein